MTDFQIERKQKRRRLLDFASRLAELRDRVAPREFGRLMARIRPFSMMSYARLKGIYKGVCDVINRDIKGDFVECGTARGGCAGLMRLTAKVRGDDRPMWVYDTFEGLPLPSVDDPDHELAKSRVGQCRGEFEDVRSLFENLGVIENTRLIKGLFQDTLPETRPESISLLHLDGDWYESTKVCLDHLYDKVTPGGVIQIDDYGHWAGARKALHEFFEARGISVKLTYLDYTGRQFVKP